ncbi:hypothetical protein BOX15_Mlig033838g3 [Macrostomum lignano]|nr:hypothetical protein BOX15_Mlig033838g2 [Macrostomum lignano]PAA70957.1 hypothetical protein BOX15_Mlig033838g1 [Macrostomum lignano]PAA80304.1 hypothetical protein BOX15_Mlig033838g3 [Macrostomum lignano]
MPRKVLLPIDGSEHADRALIWFAENLARPTDELIFVYAIEIPGNMASAMGGIVPQQKVQQQQQQQSEEQEKAVRRKTSMSALAGPGKRLAMVIQERCQQLGMRNHVRFVEKMTPGPGQSIVEAANREEANMIVMGNRGMGALKRTFLGSVSDHVLHHAHIPVIIVPPEKSAASGKQQRKSSSSVSS